MIPISDPRHKRSVAQLLRGEAAVYAISPACRSLAARDRNDFWLHLGIRIALAGGLYPVVVIVGWGTILGVVSGVVDALALAQGESLAGMQDFAGVLVGSAVALPSAFAAGFMATALTAMLVLPAVGGTIRLLGESPPPRCGGRFLRCDGRVHGDPADRALDGS